MENVKIMVVDDTITYRQILSNVVETLDGAELAATASSGKTALMKIPSIKPHLIFLDIMMPEMDGIETLHAIKKDYPMIQIVMVSGFDLENAKATLQSLEDGALDFIPKPVVENMEAGIRQLQTSLQPLVDLVRSKVFKDLKISPVIIPKPVIEITKAERKKLEGPINLVLIGISTGGPNALHKLFELMQTRLTCPVMIVQHMPPMFTKSLAERLNSVSPMEIIEAENEDILTEGRVYIAPGGKHMVVRGKTDGSMRIGITDAPPVNHCKPAVDVLFRSVAGIKNANPLSVIMTGMGRDGTEGIKTLRRKGTYCLIQDEKTSVVWGMPGSVYEADCADEILPLEKIADRIIQLTSE
ncbi:MAG: chemotaxis-specific protein-glutamate methyltransferase CheB [Deltaproteobacteria bacterium]|nr:chemotaxis-specific protein-glutamate methyltransferase CheB [Deltaproteobacteria bacterium]